MAEHFIGFVQAETIKAVFFQDHYFHEPQWFPKSQINILPGEGMETQIIATTWICKQNDLKEFTEILPEENL